MSAAAHLAGFVDRLLRPRGGLVLCWHLVEGGVGGPVDLPRARFAEQLDALLQTGLVRSLATVATTGQGIALTFDDAFENFADVVWPMLVQRALPATLFVPTGFIDGTHGSPLSTAPHLRPCRWAQLRAMADAGLALGAHSVTHRDLRGVVDDELEEELASAQARIAVQTGQTPRAFCWPQAKWNPRGERIARRYYDVIVVGGGTRTDGTTPWRTPRVSIARGGLPFPLILRAPVEPREWLGDLARRHR